MDSKNSTISHPLASRDEVGMSKESDLENNRVNEISQQVKMNDVKANSKESLNNDESKFLLDNANLKYIQTSMEDVTRKITVEDTDTAATNTLPTNETHLLIARETETFLNAGEENPTDEVDALPANLRYSNFDLMYTLISVLTYLFDLVMDCAVAYYFYHLAAEHGIYHYWYFGLTVSFVLIPSLTMTGFSLRWYLMDGDNEHLPKVPLWRWILRLLALILQLAPVLRYIDSIRYGLLSRKAGAEENGYSNDHIARKNARERRIKYYTLMVYEDADATLLRLFECFMESAPQLVLQIYILIRDPQAAKISALKNEGSSAEENAEEANQMLKYSLLIVSVVSSLISLAWSLVVYHRSLRYTYPNKKNLDCLGSVFQFLWHFSSITARVIALSLFASVYQQWIGVVCLLHWAIMSAWVIQQRTKACNTKIEEIFFSFVLGAIYIFSFFNAKDEPTRHKYVFYYTFCLVENTILIALWAMHWHGFITYSAYGRLETGEIWYFYPGIIGHYLAFTAGVGFMVTYYYFFHPSGDVNKSFLSRRPKRSAVNEETVEPSKQCEPQDNHRISLDNIAKCSTTIDDSRISQRTNTARIDREYERPTELYVEVNEEQSNSKPVTPSLSSPVLDNIDHMKGQESIPENTLIRSASVPTVTPPLTKPRVDLYLSAHRRLKAMHGKEKFRSGDNN